MRERRVYDGEIRQGRQRASGDRGNGASANTKKNFRDMCSFYKVPYFEYGTKEELGHAMGKEMRASLAVIDDGFAGTLKKHLETAVNETEGTECQK